MSQAERFWEDAGNNLISDFPLNPESLVYDVGGYLGDWTAFVHRKYNCNVTAFEPVKEFYFKMVERFRNNTKIIVMNVGLEDRDYKTQLATMGDASSLYLPHRQDEKFIEIKDVNSFRTPDLIAINGEGCEYKLLNRLIEVNKLPEHILVQFHDFVPDAEEKRNQIREALKRTHKENFCYSFVWESWSKR